MFQYSKISFATEGRVRILKHGSDRPSLQTPIQVLPADAAMIIIGEISSTRLTGIKVGDAAR